MDAFWKQFLPTTTSETRKGKNVVKESISKEEKTTVEEKIEV